MIPEADKPPVKSEKIPGSDGGGAVTVVDRENYKEIVEDPTKDVFVMYYAPWNPSCKAVSAVWDELNDAFATDENVVIAKFDANTHQPFGMINELPTFIYYPKNFKMGKKYYEVV